MLLVYPSEKAYDEDVAQSPEKTKRRGELKEIRRERERLKSESGELEPIDYFSPLLVAGTLHERNYDSLTLTLPLSVSFSG